MINKGKYKSTQVHAHTHTLLRISSIDEIDNKKNIKIGSKVKSSAYMQMSRSHTLQHPYWLALFESLGWNVHTNNAFKCKRCALLRAEVACACISVDPSWVERAQTQVLIQIRALTNQEAASEPRYSGRENGWITSINVSRVHAEGCSWNRL